MILRRVPLCVAVVAHLVEHSIGNGEVVGSIPINGSKRLTKLKNPLKTQKELRFSGKSVYYFVW